MTPPGHVRERAFDKFKRKRPIEAVLDANRKYEGEQAKLGGV